MWCTDEPLEYYWTPQYDKWTYSANYLENSDKPFKKKSQNSYNRHSCVQIHAGQDLSETSWASWAILHSSLEETLLVLIGSLFFTGPLWLIDVPGAVRREMREKRSTSPFCFLHLRKLQKQITNTYNPDSIALSPSQSHIHSRNVHSAHIVLYSMKTVSAQIFFCFGKMTLTSCLNSLG